MTKQTTIVVLGSLRVKTGILFHHGPGGVCSVVRVCYISVYKHSKTTESASFV